MRKSPSVSPLLDAYARNLSRAPAYRASDGPHFLPALLGLIRRRGSESSVSALSSSNPLILKALERTPGRCFRFSCESALGISGRQSEPLRELEICAGGRWLEACGRWGIPLPQLHVTHIGFTAANSPGAKSSPYSSCRGAFVSNLAVQVTAALNQSPSCNALCSCLPL